MRKLSLATSIILVTVATAHAADLAGLPAETDTVIRTHIFDPAVLETPAYATIKAEAEALVLTAPAPADFAKGYSRLWRKAGPVSHVQMSVARGTAAQMAEYLDGKKGGPEAFSMEWKGDIAVLTVNSMMGSDTIERVHAAFQEIASKGAKGVILDFRANGGGAFVGVALVGHLIKKPYDAGGFYSRQWVDGNKGLPKKADAKALKPWTGWSIRSFWTDVIAAPVTRIQFQPIAPYYKGPVYVLTSKATASAAEMTADALKGSGRATLIGERTAGQMLSQKPFDLAGGMQLFLPIANYVSWHSGPIEGKGVTPTKEVAADQALTEALKALGGS